MSEKVENEAQKELTKKPKSKAQKEHEAQTQREVLGDVGSQDETGSEKPVKSDQSEDLDVVEPVDKELSKQERDELKNSDSSKFEDVDLEQTDEPVELDDIDDSDEQAVRKPNALFIVLVNTASSQVVQLEGDAESDNKKASKALVDVVKQVVDEMTNIPKENYDEIEGKLPEVFDGFVASQDLTHQIDVAVSDVNDQNFIANVVVQKTYIA